VRYVLVLALVFWSAMLSAAPTVVLEDITGKKQTLNDFDNKVTLVHFWATWCVPCRHELPQLIKVAKVYADKGLRLVLVAADRRDDVKTYIEKQQIEVPVLIDQYGAALRQYQVKGLPYTSIVDHTGEIVANEQGAQDWQSHAMTTRLEGLLSRVVEK